MEPVVYDGVTLSDMYTVLAVRGLSTCNVSYEQVPGGEGITVMGVDRVPPTLTLVFVIDGGRDNPSAVRELMAQLDVDTPRKLELGEDGGLYCYAMPSGEPTWKRTPFGSAVEVPFLVTDSTLYGEERSVNVPYGESVTFSVGGSCVTRPTVSASYAAPDGETGLWGVTLDGGPTLRFAIESGLHVVAADCAGRVSTVDGYVTIPTIDSSWLELSPGEHTMELCQGTGAATVTWREGWRS